ncbi:hypothetical protein F8M41_004455 [Gigaspora margarita]|uniref:Zn(2)-C6 fungal-type domain-containing protein n=1 Tax=Gigaspora margarita TaxID=4874 RepID=A0A8H3XB82_GIGMA|nr:hypothetical protein F8M41_004455 [Gigaspora margarita]
MPQPRSRNHATQACTNCQNKRQKCKRPSDRDACEYCKNNKSRCVIIWGRKRGRKPHPNKTTEANKHTITMSTNPYKTNEEFQSPSSNFETPQINNHTTTIPFFETNPYEANEEFQSPF